MTALDQIPALRIRGETISLASVLRTLGHTGKTTFLIEAARELLMERAARERGLTVSDEELQTAADQFRATWNLHGAEETRAWLAARNWDVSDLEHHLELQILRDGLMDLIATPERVEQHFANYQRNRDKARLAHILVEDQSLAEELAAQIHDEDADFAALARKFSMDEATAHIGGELGLIDRTSLSPSIEAAVFAATDGDIVGPAEGPRGFHLVRIHALVMGQLDASAADAIRTELFKQWLDKELQNASVSCPLFEECAGLV